MRRPAFLVFLFALALSARLAATGARGFARPLEGDEKGYFAIAGNVAAGRGFRLDESRAVGAAEVELTLRSSRPPLWPAVLAGVRCLGGGIAAGRALAAVFGALSVAALFALGRRLSSEFAARLAALAFAVWPAHLYVCGMLLSEPVAILLLLLSALALQSGRTLAGGALCGLSLLARPAGLPFLLPALLATAVVPAFRGRRLTAAAAFLLGALAIPAPWIARNAVLHGRPLLTSNLGVTFIGGNNGLSLEDSWPGGWIRPDRVLSGDPPEYGFFGFAGLTEAESDREFLRRGLEWIRANPERFVRLLGWKAVRFFDPDQHSRQADRALKRWAGWLSFGPVLPLAVLGAFLLRRRARELVVLYGLAAAPLLTALVFYGDARMRLPAEPAFLLLAAAAVERILRRGACRGAGRESPSA